MKSDSSSLKALFIDFYFSRLSLYLFSKISDSKSVSERILAKIDSVYPSFLAKHEFFEKLQEKKRISRVDYDILTEETLIIKKIDMIFKKNT